MRLAALRTGIVVAMRRPLLALPLYLANLLLGLAPMTVLMLGFAELAADRPWAGSLLAPGWPNQLAEIVVAIGALVGGSVTDPSGRLGGAVASAALVVGLGGLALLLQGLAYNVLAGGILERLRDGPVAPLWPACRRWFWPFTRLGVLGIVVLGLLALGGGLVLDLIGAVLGPSLGFVAGLAWLAVVNGWLELARAGMVSRGDPSASRALRRATRLALDRRGLPVALVTWLSLALAGLGVAALQSLAVMAFELRERMPWLALLTALTVAQFFLFVGAWLKVARLAVALALDAALDHPIEIQLRREG